jgi:hypothetical protein
MYSFAAWLGILTTVFIALSMTRKIVVLRLGTVVKRMKETGKKNSFELKLLLMIQRMHRYFGMLALLFAFAHGAVIFSQGILSLTGGTLILLLILQGISGVMQEKKLGNLRLWSKIHDLLPLIMVVLIVLHIFLNDMGY